MLLAVLEVVLEGVKRLSGLDIEDSSRLTPDILIDEDVGPKSGEATVEEGSQDSFVFFLFSQGLILNGISRILPGVCGLNHTSLHRNTISELYNL